MIALTTGSATDVGRVRLSNEDSLLVAAPIFAVADGMGGYAGGAVASAIAVARLRRLCELDSLKTEDVHAALVDANNEIVERGQTDAETLGMGTTVAGLALVETSGSEYWLVFNVGDSRVYRLAEGVLAQVSVDHSYMQELVEEGRITPDEALTHPERNVVTRALGSEPDVAPDLWLMAPEEGELFLLCSDGLTRELSVAQMATVLRRAGDPQTACDELVAAALEAGGRDNVSVVVIQVGSKSIRGELDEVTVPPSGLRREGQSEDSVTPQEEARDSAEPAAVAQTHPAQTEIITAVPGVRSVTGVPSKPVPDAVIQDVPGG